ncbi:Uroplakin-3b, partial [Acanthisitta chloris]
LPTPPAQLSYVPRVPPVALLGKVTATTFVLERPCCVFDRHANASDTVWLVVAFVNASATFRNPLARVDVPLYKQLPTASSYMTLETAVAAYACSAPSPDVLRVGADTACRDHGRQDHCNGPLPSPGPYSPPYPSPCLLPALSPSTIDPVPTHCSGGVVVITSILASLGTVLAATVLGALG